MFILNLTYKVPLEMVDQHLDSHVEYLNRQYEAGYFLMSGRKVPRTGGIILCKAQDRNELLQIIEQDPFKIHDLADYEITEFIATKTCEALKSLTEI